MGQIDQLNGVVVFVEAARARSFTRAAGRLGLTKSAVGKSVARLEERLGTRLFYRTTRSLSLTPDGEAYLASCAVALDELAAAEAALTARNQPMSGRLRIDLPAAFGRRIVLPVLLDIAATHPALRLQLSFTDRLVDPIEDGIDLVVRFGALQDWRGLMARRLTEQRLPICASPRYLRARGTPESVEALEGHDCIVGLARPFTWSVVDPAGRTGRIVPPATHRLGDGDAILAAALAGLGLVQLPSSLVRRELERGELVAVLAHATTTVPVHALWPQTCQLLPRVRRIVDELAERAAAGKLD